MNEDTKFKIEIAKHAIGVASECLAWIGESPKKEDLFSLADEIMNWERQQVGKWMKDESK